MCGWLAEAGWSHCPNCGTQSSLAAAGPSPPVPTDEEEARPPGRRIRLVGWVMFWLGVAGMTIMMVVVLPVIACVPSLQDRPAGSFAIGLLVSVGITFIAALLLSPRKMLGGLFGFAHGGDGDSDDDGDGD